ncbi:aspartate carbamoyltransferase [Sarracenia purpurea var. burkii]
MASSSSSYPFSTYSLHGAVSVSKGMKRNRKSLSNHSSLFRQSSRSRLIAMSAYLALSRVKTVQCRALEVDNKPSFLVGNEFQLDDVIEAQQFDRDILSAIF